MAPIVTNYMYAKITKDEVYALLKATYNVAAYYELLEFENDPTDSSYFRLIFKDTR